MATAKGGKVTTLRQREGAINDKSHDSEEEESNDKKCGSSKEKSNGKVGEDEDRNKNIPPPLAFQSRGMACGLA